MDDLLKEAIADAKAVRETALENAKMALEEAFTPRLQNMLSQKNQNEIEDEDDMEEREMDEEDMEYPGQYTMQIFGVDTNNQSISVKVTDFKPIVFAATPLA